MRILVTGGAGFVGRHLLRELAGRGAALCATTLDDVPEARDGDAGLAEVEWVRMDLTSGESISRALDAARPDIVYHLAGQASVGQSFVDPVATWEVNATGTLRLCDSLTRAPTPVKRFLLISSAEVYGSVDRSEQPIGETRPTFPVTPYGVSKAAAELAALSIGRVTGTRVVVARSFNHIGPGQDERFFLPSVARQLVAIRREGREPIVRVGNLEITRDLLDVRDVVKAYVTLMEEGEAGGVYNVCSGQGRSLGSIVRRLLELSGTGAQLEVDPARVRSVDIPALVGDPSALTALGWSPTIGVDATLRDMLAEAETHR